ncbi:hypothetical protein LW135_03785 [Helicobacter sp. faydin-H20]|uniref:hypothetical protein n=1 Tax=Helicobacter anatolicus TaxID=2905874 RepID=UPI001E5C88B0|nr:hypothetical protein [Helicobacter anatolicus]MCE3036949.1 hypothetical protein [Helicobacter anatolicus]
MRIISAIKKFFISKKIFNKKFHSTPYFFKNLPADTLTLSTTYQKIQQLQPQANYLQNKNTLLDFTKQLQEKQIIDDHEKIALHFLIKKSKKIDFKSFNAFAHQKNLNEKMQKLLIKSIHKLQMVHYITSHSS